MQCSVREAQERVTSAEFVEYRHVRKWEADQELKTVTKDEHYFARLIAETRRSWVKDPSKVKEDDFLITFLTREEIEEKKKAKESVDPVKEAARQLAIEKTTWGILTGRLIPKGKQKNRGKRNGSIPSSSNTRRPPHPKRK